MASKVEEHSSSQSFLARQLGLFAKGFSFSGYERDLFCLNKGDGTFLDVSGVSGIDFIGDGRGTAFADLDDDGDLDVFLKAQHGAGHLLFRNNVGREAGFVRVSLQGTTCGRDAFGATVRLKTSRGTPARVKSGGSGFLSESDPRILFGLDGGARPEWLEVTWPTGLVQRFAGPTAGASVLAVEGEAELRIIKETPRGLPDPLPADELQLAGIKVRPGQTLPALALLGLDGRAATGAAPWKGRATVVNFWATWCVPCRREMPELARLAAGGLPVVGISLDEAGDTARVRAFVDELGVRYPVLLAGDGVADVLWEGGNANLPLSLVVGADGKVTDVLPGWSRRTRQRLVELAR